MRHMSLTINELAAEVAADADPLVPDVDVEELDLVVERIKYWSLKNLLPMDGDSRPGRGRARRFSTDAILVAKILNALADFGIGAGVAENFDLFNDVLRKVNKAMITLDGRDIQGRVLCLITYRGRRLGKKSQVSLFDSFDTVPADKRAQRIGDDVVRSSTPVVLPPLAESAIVINLTRLFLGTTAAELAAEYPEYWRQSHQVRPKR
jgi:hypothetical protein